jgi:hypothetical protein
MLLCVRPCSSQFAHPGGRTFIIDKTHYEAVTPQQNLSLQWLVNELYGHFNLKGDDVYRHSDVSYKNPDEAGSATWQ